MKKALALRQSSAPLLVIDVEDALYTGPVERIGSIRYEELPGQRRRRRSPGSQPADEWDAIALNYTSGTTGNPKGVVYHHRGAALNAISNILEWDMPKHAVYLWTLPMFHCNGWCFPWTIAARAGVNVCLRRVEAAGDLRRDPRSTASPTTAARPSCTACWSTRRTSMKQGLPRGVKAMVAGAAPPASDDRGHGGAGLRPHPRLRPDRGLRPGDGLRQAGRLGRARRSASAPA